MTLNVSFKRTFKINGKEYGSLEDMPEDVRLAFEKKAGSAGSNTPGIPAKMPSPIVFNGIEYPGIDEMPTYARNLYEQAMAAAEADAQGSAADHDPRRGSQPVRAEPSFSAKSAVAAFVLIALALLLYYLLGR
jgi:hypothetical protein